jgi:hypothetical protein|tara:strand:+ start:370 stop:582 length:213 start_codon:yes stop_codon:yes gene_type:complete
MDKKHLQNVGLTYLSHLKFTTGEVLRLLGMAVVMLVHGLIPWVWSCKFSDYIADARMRIMVITGLTERKK